MTTSPFIAFEGPIAAGKTTLASMLSAHTSSSLILEDFQGNEFLADFYQDRDRWALPMQLWFLNARMAQMNALARHTFRPIVMDYSHFKDEMFARVLLTSRELRLYQQISKHITLRVSPPDLIIYLDADDDVLLDRILRRGRPYEQKINRSYLERLRVAYRGALSDWPAASLLRFDTSNLDLRSQRQMDTFYDAALTAAYRPRAEP